MSATSFTLKELKEKWEDGELDLSLSSLTGDDIPIKHFKQLKKIQALDLSNNVLVSLPNELCSSLPYLVKLDLSKNLLTALPANIGQLTNLKSLDLLGNRLSTLPESFGDLSSLVWLDVRDNPLSAAILKEAGDCLDDKQCKTCAIRVVKLMNYVHVEREKIRVEEKAKQEAETKAREEEEKAEKKQRKQLEKERRRKEYLLQKQNALESEPTSSVGQPGGDKPAGSVKYTERNSPPVATGGVCGSLCSMVTLIIILSLITAAVFSTAYHYCETTLHAHHICTTPLVLSIREYIQHNFIPLIVNLKDMVNTYIN